MCGHPRHTAIGWCESEQDRNRDERRPGAEEGGQIIRPSQEISPAGDQIIGDYRHTFGGFQCPHWPPCARLWWRRPGDQPSRNRSAPHWLRSQRSIANGPPDNQRPHWPSARRNAGRDINHHTTARSWQRYHGHNTAHPKQPQRRSARQNAGRRPQMQPYRPTAPEPPILQPYRPMTPERPQIQPHKPIRTRAAINTPIRTPGPERQ